MRYLFKILLVLSLSVSALAQEDVLMGPSKIDLEKAANSLVAVFDQEIFSINVGMYNLHYSFEIRDINNTTTRVSGKFENPTYENKKDLKSFDIINAKHISTHIDLTKVSIVPGSIEIGIDEVDGNEEDIFSAIYIRANTLFYYSFVGNNGKVFAEGYLTQGPLGNIPLKHDITLTNLKGEVVEYNYSNLTAKNVKVRYLPIRQLMPTNYSCTNFACATELFGQKYFGRFTGGETVEEIVRFLKIYMEQKEIACSPELCKGKRMTLFNVANSGMYDKATGRDPFAAFLFETRLIDSYQDNFYTNAKLNIGSFTPQNLFTYAAVNYLAAQPDYFRFMWITNPLPLQEVKKILVNDWDMIEALRKALAEMQFPLPAGETYKSFVIYRDIQP